MSAQNPASVRAANAFITIIHTCGSLAVFPGLNTSGVVPTSSESPRLLVVDDNESIRDFLHHFFRMEGIPVEIFASPRQALARFCAAPHAFSGLLTDCEMPGMSGLELAQEVRRVRADVPMIMFSTSVTVLGAARFLKQGFVHALPKPAPLVMLRAAVRSVVGKESAAAASPPPVPRPAAE